MILNINNIAQTTINNLRGGDGSVLMRNVLESKKVEHCRLYSEIVIPANASIGLHEHIEETEFYYILEGSGVVTDDGSENIVNVGDVVITGGGESHSIKNPNSTNLKLLACIVTNKK